MTEFPYNGRKVWIGPLTKLHKTGTSKRKCGPRTVPNKLVCWCRLSIFNTECEADYDTNSSDLDSLEMFIKLIFMQRNCDKLVRERSALATIIVGRRVVM